MVAHAHILAVASGYGLRVIPKTAPYRFALGSDPDQLDAECEDQGNWYFARVTPDGGGYRSQLSPNTATLGDVADVVSGPAWPQWWLETSIYRLPLLPGWVASATGVPGELPFDILGPDQAVIFVQTPRTAPVMEQLVAPGQVVIERGTTARSEWIRVSYRHADAEWIQRHDVVRSGGLTCIVTLQSPFAAATAAARAHVGLVNDMQLTPGTAP